MKSHVSSVVRATEGMMEEAEAVRRDMTTWLQEEHIKQEVARLEMRLAKAQRQAQQLEQENGNTDAMRLEREMHDLEARLLSSLKDRDHTIAKQVRALDASTQSTSNVLPAPLTCESEEAWTLADQGPCFTRRQRASLAARSVFAECDGNGSSINMKRANQVACKSGLVVVPAAFKSLGGPVTWAIMSAQREWEKHRRARNRNRKSVNLEITMSSGWYGGVVVVQDRVAEAAQAQVLELKHLLSVSESNVQIRDTQVELLKLRALLVWSSTVVQ